MPSSEALPWPCSGPCEPPWGSTAALGFAGPSPPLPDDGAGAGTGPPKGIAPTRSCTPPPCTGKHHHPGVPLMMAAEAVPHPPLCPLHDLHVGALCSSYRVCMGRRSCPPLFPPGRCACRGGEGEIAAPPPPYDSGSGWCIPLGGGSGTTCIPVPAAPDPPSLSLKGGGGGSASSFALVAAAPAPPTAIPQGLLLWRGLPPLTSCPLLHQPGGDGLKNIDQPLGGVSGGWHPPPPPAAPAPCAPPPLPTRRSPARALPPLPPPPRIPLRKTRRADQGTSAGTCDLTCLSCSGCEPPRWNRIGGWGGGSAWGARALALCRPRLLCPVL